MAGPRRAARGHRGPRARARPAADHLPRVRRRARRAGSTRPSGSPCSTARTPSRSAATTRAPTSRAVSRPPPTSATAPRSSRSAAAPPPGTPARPHPPPSDPDSSAILGCPPRQRSDESAGGAVGEVLAGVRAGQEPGESTSSSRCSAPAGPRSRRSPSSPTSCAARRSATPSPGCTTATSTTPTCARSSARSAGSPRVRCRLNLRGTPYLLTLDDIAERAAEAADAGRHRGVPAGRHPPELRRRLLHRRDPRREGRGARHARPRLHRPRGHRGRQAPRRAARGVPHRGSRTPASARCRARPPRSSTTRSAPILCPDKVNTEEWLDAHATAHGVGLRSQHHDHVRLGRAAGALGPPPGAHPRPAEAHRRLHRVRAAAVRAHGRADLPAARRPPRARPSARPCSCTPSRRIAYRGLVDNIQASWVKIGQDGARQLLARRRQRPRWHPDGREHQPRRRRRPRPAGHARRARASWPPRPAATAVQRTTLYGAVDRRAHVPP